MHLDERSESRSIPLPLTGCSAAAGAALAQAERRRLSPSSRSVATIQGAAHFIQTIWFTFLNCAHPHPIRADAQERPAFRYRKRSRTVVDTAEEAYLRVDIPCGSPACPVCAPTSPALLPSPRHLVLPDSAALKECLEVWELAQVEGLVLLSSELRQVGGGGAPRGLFNKSWTPRPVASWCAERRCGAADRRCSNAFRRAASHLNGRLTWPAWHAGAPPRSHRKFPAPSLPPSCATPHSSWTAATCGAPPACRRCTPTGGGATCCLTTCTTGKRHPQGAPPSCAQACPCWRPPSGAPAARDGLGVGGRWTAAAWVQEQGPLVPGCSSPLVVNIWPASVQPCRALGCLRALLPRLLLVPSLPASPPQPPQVLRAPGASPASGGGVRHAGAAVWSPRGGPAAAAAVPAAAAAACTPASSASSCSCWGRR